MCVVSLLRRSSCEEKNGLCILFVGEMLNNTKEIDRWIDLVTLSDTGANDRVFAPTVNKLKLRGNKLTAQSAPFARVPYSKRTRNEKKSLGTASRVALITSPTIPLFISCLYLTVIFLFLPPFVHCLLPEWDFHVVKLVVKILPANTCIRWISRILKYAESCYYCISMYLK